MTTKDILRWLDAAQALWEDDDDVAAEAAIRAALTERDELRIELAETRHQAQDFELENLDLKVRLAEYVRRAREITDRNECWGSVQVERFIRSLAAEKVEE